MDSIMKLMLIYLGPFVSMSEMVEKVGLRRFLFDRVKAIMLLCLCVILAGLSSILLLHFFKVSLTLTLVLNSAVLLLAFFLVSFILSNLVKDIRPFCVIAVLLTWLLPSEFVPISFNLSTANFGSVTLYVAGLLLMVYAITLVFSLILVRTNKELFCSLAKYKVDSAK